MAVTFVRIQLDGSKKFKNNSNSFIRILSQDIVTMTDGTGATDPTTSAPCLLAPGYTVTGSAAKDTYECVQAPTLQELAGFFSSAASGTVLPFGGYGSGFIAPSVVQPSNIPSPWNTTTINPVMQGYAAPYTVVKSGSKLTIWAFDAEQITDSNALTEEDIGIQVSLRYGTGSAPANQAASTGSAASTNVSNFGANFQKQTGAHSYVESQLSMIGQLTAPAAGTVLWFDVQVQTSPIGLLVTPSGMVMMIIES